MLAGKCHDVMCPSFSGANQIVGCNGSAGALAPVATDNLVCSPFLWPIWAQVPLRKPSPQPPPQLPHQLRKIIRMHRGGRFLCISLHKTRGETATLFRISLNFISKILAVHPKDEIDFRTVAATPEE